MNLKSERRFVCNKMELQFIILHVHEHPLQQKVCEIKLNNILDKWICSIPSTHEMARNMSGPDNM